MIKFSSYNLADDFVLSDLKFYTEEEIKNFSNITGYGGFELGKDVYTGNYWLINERPKLINFKNSLPLPERKKSMLRVWFLSFREAVDFFNMFRERAVTVENYLINPAIIPVISNYSYNLVKSFKTLTVI